MPRKVPAFCIERSLANTHIERMFVLACRDAAGDRFARSAGRARRGTRRPRAGERGGTSPLRGAPRTGGAGANPALAARRGRRAARVARLVRRARLGARPPARGDGVRRLRSRDDRPLACLLPDLRDRGRPDPRARDQRHIPDSRGAEDRRTPGRAASHRPLRRHAATSARRANGDPPVLVVRRLLRADRPQRSLRRRVREPRARTDDRQAPRRDRDRHGPARPESPRPPRPANEPRVACLLLRRVRPAVPPGTSRRAGDGRGLPAPR